MSGCSHEYVQETSDGLRCRDCGARGEFIAQDEITQSLREMRALSDLRFNFKELSDRLREKAQTLRQMAEVNRVEGRKNGVRQLGRAVESSRLSGKAEGVELALENIRQALNTTDPGDNADGST